MVRTDGRTDRRTDTEGYNIIPRHTLVAGYKNGSGIKKYKSLKITQPQRVLKVLF